MVTLHNFRRALSALLLSVTAVTLLLPTISHAQTQPVTVTITEVWDLAGDMEGDVFPSPGDLYAVAIINGTKHDTFANHFDFPGDIGTGYIFPWGPLFPDPAWVMTQEVPSDAGSVPVLIQIWDSDDNILDDDDDQADINPIAGSYTLVLNVDLATGRWSGDINWPQNCVEGSDERDARVCFDISMVSASGDADEDGLLDSWEQNGFNADGDGTIDVNLPAFGANPRRKDVFVEVDCLVATNHSHCPQKDAISDAVRSFANAPVANLDGTTGVQLHVDTGTLFGAGTISVPGTRGVTGTYGNFGGGGTQIAEAGNEIIESFSSPKGNGEKFADLREAFFDSRRDLLFRYAIFGHQTNYRQATDDCTSGEANSIPGNEFIVTLGGNIVPTFPCWDPDANGFSVGNRAEQAGTFMHELGHTLGLDHAGDSDLPNNKPNYLSVMNYAFQDCRIPPSPNGFLPGGCDYSRIVLPPLASKFLDERSLDECIGIDAGQLGFGSRKWDADDLLEGATCPAPNNKNIRADINGNGNDDEILLGFNDWPNLKFSLVAIASAGSAGSLPVEDEADPETIRQARQFMATMAAPGVVVDKSGPATAKPGDLLTYTTQIRNQGRGPALQAALTDTRPDGGTQVEALNAIVVGGLVTRTSNFTVPLNACPGSFTGASASVAFKDMVSNQLTASDTAPLEILDVQAPTLTVTVSPSVIVWSPSHDLRTIVATITVTDNCDPQPAITLVSVTSNESESGFLGEGDKSPDIVGAAVGTDDRSFSVRAERKTGGQSTGRVYTVTYRATDRSGNTKDAVATVTVPTSMSGS